MTEPTTKVKTTDVLGLLTGALFVFSGVSKVLDTHLFAQTISSYGFPSLQFLAPHICAGEVVVGLFLAFGIHHRWSALVSAVMVVIFTLAYSYALFFHGITDCGCFGGFTQLNGSPVFLYAKNALLLVLLSFLVWRGEDTMPHHQWVHAMVLLMVAGVSMQAGLTYKKGSSHADDDLLLSVTPLQDSKLNDILELSPDSSYVVFVFSYSCPHCMNAIANVNEYTRFGVADHVVGLALGDSLARRKFCELTDPRFPIHDLSKELLELTTVFPRLYYVEGDSIRMDLTGEIPAACLLKAALRNKTH